MNKLTFIFSFILISSFGLNAQKQAEKQDTLHYAFSLKDNKIYYERIIGVQGQNRDNLYKIVKSWGVNAFNSQKDVLQADDKETGIIAYKFFFTKTFQAPKIFGVVSTAEWKYWQVMKVFLKDEKIKVIIEDVELNEVGYGGFKIETFKSSTEEYFKKSMMGKGYREKYYAETYENFQSAHAKITDMIDDLEKALKSGKSDFDF